MGAICPCRTPFQKVTTVEGRLLDVLLRPRADGPGRNSKPHRPDDALTQHTPGHFTLECTATPRASFLQGLNEVLQKPARLDLVPLRPNPSGQKRRRFQRLFDLGNRIIVEELLNPAARLSG